ncbi:MAG: flagellar basal-body rod protein FlgB [Candidatus Melainabacteria bacterium GWF2_37_15]|nr:MAG: flagellar basal-body rod protein FlgB [Candidatus Melainabacteria bacterium GWF2_37_15]
MDLLNKREMQITSLALDGLSERHKAITSNIANSNTPGYMKVDVAFEGQLNKILESEEAKEQNKEIKNPIGYSSFKPSLIISNDPAQSANGNNVNVEMEMAELAKNGMKYNALAALQAKAFKGLSDVIMGGGR